MESFGRKDGPRTAPGAEVSGWRTEGSRGESSFPGWAAGRTVEPFPEPRNLGKEWSGRAEILRSSRAVSEALVGGQRRCAGATLSTRVEVCLEAVTANYVLCLLRSLGPNMCLRRLLQSAQLQRAWRAVFGKHGQGRHQGAWRWTHSGGGTYRAVIFDMGGVLIPSPGRVAAGELFILLHLWRLWWVGVGERRVVRGDGSVFQWELYLLFIKFQATVSG